MPSWLALSAIHGGNLVLSADAARREPSLSAPVPAAQAGALILIVSLFAHGVPVSTLGSLLTSASSRLFPTLRFELTLSPVFRRLSRGAGRGDFGRRYHCAAVPAV